LAATVAADRAFPAAVAELDRLGRDKPMASYERTFMKNKMQIYKRLFCIVYLIAAALVGTSAKAQGVVDFQNTGTTQITTNSFTGATGPTLGAGNYLFGLYVGPFGSPLDSLSPVGSAANISLPGLFGTSGNFVNVAFPPGTQVSFQVRGWSTFAGSSFEQANAYAAGANFPIAYLGVSAPGFFTVPSSGSVVLFGTGPGQVGGFELTPIPEPSFRALGLLAVLTLYIGFFRRNEPKAEHSEHDNAASS
jgi:hypothetical protein